MAIDLLALKSGGFMPQKQKNNFSLRIKVVGGNLTAEQLQVVTKAALKFGKGKVHLTSRQALEIPFVKYKDVEPIQKFLAKGGVVPGVSGPKVRTVCACQGASICPWGLIDTTTLAEQLSGKFSGTPIPSKFKLGVTGCPNNCLKAEQHDLGVKGGFFIDLEWEKCKKCGLCVKSCRYKALTLIKDKGMEIDPIKCVNCGKCVKVCPVKAWKGTPGYRVYFGGTFGNRINIGRAIFPLISDLKIVFTLVKSSLDYFGRYGSKGERFRTCLDREGWDKFSLALQDASGLVPITLVA
ncbi:MAG: 4Fe-4S binding protein [Deltaproteobacteria bacterium]|nr:4Fe-4S binding protein [Deltaproteobacteria bacterium]